MARSPYGDRRLGVACCGCCHVPIASFLGCGCDDSHGGCVSKALGGCRDSAVATSQRLLRGAVNARVFHHKIRAALWIATTQCSCSCWAVFFLARVSRPMGGNGVSHLRADLRCDLCKNTSALTSRAQPHTVEFRHLNERPG